MADGAQFRELLRPLELNRETEDAWYEILSGVASRIRGYRLPVQTISVDDYETVAEIFNRVNTGGKPLSKGDLIMGAMAARWQGMPAHDGKPEVKSGRQYVDDFEADLRAKNWGINREVLLRIMSVLSPAASPNHTRLLELTSEDQWKEAWAKTEDAVNHAIGFLRNDAGIPASSLLPTQTSSFCRRSSSSRRAAHSQRRISETPWSAGCFGQRVWPLQRIAGDHSV